MRLSVSLESTESEHGIVNFETPQPISQPGMAERAVNTATDVSRTITEVSAALQAAVNQLSRAIATARQPGKPLSTISAITREAPLASLFVAFLFGVAVAPEGVMVENPAFDVTPNRYVAGIITEQGVARAPYTESLRKLV